MLNVIFEERNVKNTGIRKVLSVQVQGEFQNPYGTVSKNNSGKYC